MKEKTMSEPKMETLLELRKELRARAAFLGPKCSENNGVHFADKTRENLKKLSAINTQISRVIGNPDDNPQRSSRGFYNQ